MYLLTMDVYQLLAAYYKLRLSCHLTLWRAIRSLGAFAGSYLQCMTSARPITRTLKVYSTSCCFFFFSFFRHDMNSNDSMVYDIIIVFIILVIVFMSTHTDFTEKVVLILHVILNSHLIFNLKT